MSLSIHPAPDHSPEQPKLNRVRGQIEGVQRMIDEHRYCPDILAQLAAARAALKAVEVSILSRHMQNCVRASIRQPDDTDRLLEELLKLFRNA
jgi:CsoR family transcriptional regulator, copper-sensing transcriptional repressor